jgi:hypothetical protein
MRKRKLTNSGEYISAHLYGMHDQHSATLPAVAARKIAVR